MAFIPQQTIETEAAKLHFQYGQDVAPAAAPPRPGDEICESYLGISIEFDDLRSKHGPKVLAATYILSKRVIIDESLVPEDHPDQEGRYNFTLGHEMGHWILHRHDAIAVRDTPDLFGIVANPVVCRSSSKDPVEIQADLLSSCLLMPADMDRDAWRRRGPDGRLNVYEEIQAKESMFGCAVDGLEPISCVVKEIAGVFHVSRRAMQIRLKGLGLLDTNKPSPQLTFSFA